MLLSRIMQASTPPLHDDNLRIHPVHPGYYEPIVNFADPQEPLRTGPFCCDTPVIDFGRIRAGQNLWVTFPVTNSGDRTIMVRALQGCSCTNSPIGPLILEPGQTGEFQLTLSTKNGNGPIRKTMTIKVIAEFDVQSN